MSYHVMSMSYIVLYYVIYHVMSYIVLYYIFFAMLCRSYSYVAFHVGHQQMALEANAQKYENFWVPLTNKGPIFMRIHVLCIKNYVSRYIRFTSTKSPSFIMITISDLTNCSALLPQSRYYSRYVTRPILAPPPLWRHKHTDLRTISSTLSTCDMSPVSIMLPTSGPCFACGINSAMPNSTNT